MLNISIDIRFFYNSNPLLKGLHTDPLKIRDIFWDVKKEMELLDKYKKR